MTITFQLPYPPSCNTYWRHNRGRTHISDAGQAYRDAVKWALVGMDRQFGRRRISLTVETHQPDRRVRDLGNLDKALSDALQAAGIYDNDGQIDELHYIRGPVDPTGAGYVRVTVSDELGEVAA